MVNRELIDTYYRLGRLSTEALEQKEYHTAFRYAQTAYLIVPESEKHMKDNALVLIWKICGDFVSFRRDDIQKPENISCSFCGRKEPQITLKQGMGWAFICNLCVSDIYNELNPK